MKKEIPVKRRSFITSTLALPAAAIYPGKGYSLPFSDTFTPVSLGKIPEKIAGMPLTDLLNDYRDRLTNRYLPFWDKGGYDSELGGFMCELYEDGSVQKDEKFIWYQGRAVWVYSFLYNNFGNDAKHLEIARKTRDFMVKYMHAGGGIWVESVNRFGKPVQSTGQGTSGDIYGAMFAAAGLMEYYKAAGNEEDLDLAKTSVWTSMKRYNDPGYTGVRHSGAEKTGLRAQGHSFMIVWPLTQLLSHIDDPLLEELVREHTGHIINDFWNPDYRIVNEILYHDYSRIPQASGHMAQGHSIEALWMVLYEAIRIKDKSLFDTAKIRIRHLIELCWDYIYDGWGSASYHMDSADTHPAGPDYSMKIMWAHTEVLIACLTVFEYTGETWAKEWYERAREYVLRTMTTDFGIWRQAVDRYGKDVKRPGISIYRRGNFHQPRCLMMNMLSLERMIAGGGNLTPFPK